MDAERAAKIRRRTLVGGGLALALGALLACAYLAAGTWLVLAVGALLALLGVLELARMGRLAELRARTPLVVAWVGTTGLALWSLQHGAGAFSPARDYSWMLVAAALLSGSAAAPRGIVGGENGRIVALACWLVPPLLALGVVRQTFGADGLVALVVLSKLGDIAGYYVGNAIGRSHPFPKLSPGKTTAGCVASLLAGMAGGAAAVAIGLLPQGALGLAGGVVAGAAINLAAQAGDLLESKAKRVAGVKDSGRWFGPSGGVLDLVDSLLLSVPAACLTWPWLFTAA